MNEYKCRQSVLIIAFWIANLVSWEVNHSQSTINKAVRHWVLQNKEYFGCIAQKNQSTAVLSCSSSTWWGKITWNWLERWRKHVREREREDERKGNPAETQSLFQFPEQPVTSIFSCRSADIGHQSHAHIHRCTNAFLSSVPMFILFSALPFLATLLHKHLWFQRYIENIDRWKGGSSEREKGKKKIKRREEEELARHLEGPKIASCRGQSNLQSHGRGENGDTWIEERGWVEEMETAINKWGDWKGKKSRHCFGLFMEVSTEQSYL